MHVTFVGKLRVVNHIKVFIWTATAVCKCVFVQKYVYVQVCVHVHWLKMCYGDGFQAGLYMYSRSLCYVLQECDSDGLDKPPFQWQKKLKLKITLNLE